MKKDLMPRRGDAEKREEKKTEEKKTEEEEDLDDLRRARSLRAAFV